mmetsp:Transcript_12031/g.17529  ORF Transcript_12031/g.17529 Transcript_12031/m.17529 type:complete len:89 (-) Transcript_12031:401-667(-)
MGLFNILTFGLCQDRSKFERSLDDSLHVALKKSKRKKGDTDTANAYVPRADVPGLKKTSNQTGQINSNGTPADDQKSEKTDTIATDTD